MRNKAVEAILYTFNANTYLLHTLLGTLTQVAGRIPPEGGFLLGTI